MTDLNKLKAKIEALVPHKHGVDYMLRGAGDWISKSEVLALIATHAAEPAPTDNTALVEAVGKMLLEGGEGFRLGLGAEVLDAYEAALSRVPEKANIRSPLQSQMQHMVNPNESD